MGSQLQGCSCIPLAAASQSCTAMSWRLPAHMGAPSSTPPAIPRACPAHPAQPIPALIPVPARGQRRQELGSTNQQPLFGIFQSNLSYFSLGPHKLVSLIDLHQVMVKEKILASLSTERGGLGMLFFHISKISHLELCNNHFSVDLYSPKIWRFLGCQSKDCCLYTRT